VEGEWGDSVFWGTGKVVLLEQLYKLPVIRTVSSMVVEGADAVGLGEGEGGVDLSVVLPSLNTGIRLETVVRSVVAELSTVEGLSFEVLVVDDGSEIPEAEWLGDLMAESGLVRLIRHSTNMGKGAAVRRGLMHSQGRVVGFIDGDGDLSPRGLVAMYSRIVQGDVDVVIARRVCRSQPTLMRRIGTKAFSFWTRIWVPMSDSMRTIELQAGAKLYRGKAIRDVLGRVVENGYSFDAELLSALHLAGWGRAAAVDVDYHPSAPTAVNFQSICQSFKSTVLVGLRARKARRNSAY